MAYKQLPLPTKPAFDDGEIPMLQTDFSVDWIDGFDEDYDKAHPGWWMAFKCHFHHWHRYGYINVHVNWCSDLQEHRWMKCCFCGKDKLIF